MTARPDVLVECATWPWSEAGLGRRVERWVRRLAPRLGLDPGEIRVRLVDPERMLELGRTHLGKTSATDVLAFPDEAHGGDLAICWEVVCTQCPHAPVDELARLCIHGLCHLAGYDHGEAAEARAMLRRERSLLRSLGVVDVPRPYGGPRSARMRERRS